MKRRSLLLGILFMMLLTLQSCELVGDIFQAGMGVGIFLVLAVIVLIIWIIAKFRK